MEEEDVPVEAGLLLEPPPEDDPEVDPEVPPDVPSDVPPEAGVGEAGADFCSG